eukprot:GILJ01004001.1.p1 GENE.GILJ01004001.1~~GILJ01004001.1.p1  ORF type:complete len:863 (-),score=152.33 GILJ01004001.1:158-2686(-)
MEGLAANEQKEREDNADGFVQVTYPHKQHKIQVVDYDGTFTQELSEFINLSGLSAVGFNYSLVAILGCQSSGKSTLLNLLFGTQFPVMDSGQGRSQTTKGIWIDKDSTTNTLVLDLEGTDSRERGEDRMSFEHKSALFALALAEVLVVNMWFQDIGRYTASNYGLLKTVFEVNLELFQQQDGFTKTTLMFIIRDHIQQVTPLDRLETMIRGDIDKIWKEIQKPAKFAESSAWDFFEFRFESLPHKVLEEPVFNQKIAALRRRFLDPSDPTFIFHGQYSKNVPADGFPRYAESIWEVIRSQDQLNIPSQKEMLANYRCDEIRAHALTDFLQAMQPLKDSIKHTFVQDFGAQCQLLIDRALEEYDGPASRYHASVCAQKREQLHERLCEELNQLFRMQMAHLRAHCLESFMNHIKANLPKTGTAVRNFSEIVKAAEKQAMDKFHQVAEASLVVNSGWTYTEALEDLQTAIADHIKRERDNQLRLLTEETKGALEGGFMHSLSVILEEAQPSMWSQVRRVHKSIMMDLESSVLEVLHGLELPELSVEEFITIFRQDAFNLIKRKTHEVLSFLPLYMLKRFDAKFRKDKDGLPRRWRPRDNIREVFIEARDDALQLLDSFAYLRANVDWHTYREDDDHIISPTTEAAAEKEKEQTHEYVELLTPVQNAEMEAKFRQEADVAYQEAHAQQERLLQQAKIPYWMIALLVFFGYDEIFSLLRSPIMLMLVVLVGGGLAVAHALGMGHLPFVIARQAFFTLSNQILPNLEETIRTQLQSFTAPPPPPTTPSASAGLQHSRSGLPATPMARQTSTSSNATFTTQASSTSLNSSLSSRPTQPLRVDTSEKMD